MNFRFDCYLTLIFSVDTSFNLRISLLERFSISFHFRTELHDLDWFLFIDTFPQSSSYLTSHFDFFRSLLRRWGEKRKLNWRLFYVNNGFVIDIFCPSQTTFPLRKRELNSSTEYANLKENFSSAFNNEQSSGLAASFQRARELRVFRESVSFDLFVSKAFRTAEFFNLLYEEKDRSFVTLWLMPIHWLGSGWWDFLRRSMFKVQMRQILN